MVWKIWSYFNHFSESILHRHAYAITLDWTQGCFCPMAHFSSYFYITSKVIHLTASKFICSELHIFLLFFVTRSSFRKTIKSFLIGQHLLSTTMQTLSALVGRLSIIMEKQSIWPNQRVTVSKSLLAFPFCIQHPVDIFQPALKQVGKVRQSRTPNGTKLTLPQAFSLPTAPRSGAPSLSFPKPSACRHPTSNKLT